MSEQSFPNLNAGPWFLSPCRRPRLAAAELFRCKTIEIGEKSAIDGNARKVTQPLPGRSE